jgi:hypothetical protein
MALSLRAYSRRSGVSVSGGVKAPMKAAGHASLRPWLASNRPAAEIWWAGHSMTKILDNGPVGSKLTIAVVGDGFAFEDQDKYNRAVDDLLMTGMFARDLFAADKSAFNVHRINLVSHQSGVSTKTYDSTGTVTGQVDRDTALNLYYSGDWGHCWLEGGPHHETRLKQALDIWVPDYRYVLILLNHPGFGGCGGGGRAYVPLGVTWATVAHEFGHAFGLADEYCGSNTYTGGEPGAVNVTVNTNRSTLKWRHHVAATTPIPTGSGACAGYNQGTQPAGWSDNQSVGLFEGASGNFNRGIYRPVINCRMRSNSPAFCPVCHASVHGQIAPFLRTSAPGTDVARGKGEVVSDESYVRLELRYDDGALSIVGAREVDGTLVEPQALVSGLAHEVRIGERRVAFASMPDAQLNRSFSEPGSKGPHDHHVYERTSFDFVVRVPRSALRGIDPAALTVDLLDVHTTRADAALQRKSVVEEPDVRTRRVASTSGLDAAQLPEALRRAIEQD